MDRVKESIMVLVAEDDPEDRMLIKEAWEEAMLANDMRFVEDGEELTDYLRRLGKYRDPATSPRPGIILLDLNMPRKDGREALSEIKGDPDLKDIPVVVLTTSHTEEDIIASYNLSVAGFIMKPPSFDRLVETIHSIGVYWFDIVQLPPQKNHTPTQSPTATS